MREPCGPVRAGRGRGVGSCPACPPGTGPGAAGRGGGGGGVGLVPGVPRRNGDEVDVRVDSPHGRVLVVAPEPVGDLPVGSEVSAEGVLESPEPWRASYLRRLGIAMVL